MKDMPEGYTSPEVLICCPTGSSGGDWQDVRGYISHSFPSNNPGYQCGVTGVLAGQFISKDICYVKNAYGYTFESFPAYTGLVRVYDSKKLYVCSLWEHNGKTVCYSLNQFLTSVPEEIMFSYEQFLKLNILS